MRIIPPLGHPPLVQLSIEAGPEAARTILQRVERALNEGDVPQALVDSAQIILAEILNNIFEHAYRERDNGPIGVRLWLVESGLWCETRDRGIAMPDNRPPNGPFPDINPDMPDDLPEGGFGWPMVHAMTQHLRFDRQGGENRLTFMIPAEPAEPSAL